jgi:hypothetical protein
VTDSENDPMEAVRAFLSAEQGDLEPRLYVHLFAILGDFHWLTGIADIAAQHDDPPRYRHGSLPSAC